MTVGLKKWLGLRKRADSGRTVKRWPVDLAEDHRGPIVTFGIPLKSAKTSKDWGRTQAILGATLRSVLGQSDPRWRILICGHEMPEIEELADPRIEFIVAGFPPPTSPRPGHWAPLQGDKQRKRLILGSRMAELGAGYFMALDADDLVHRDLVATALNTEHGCVITTGYICDAGSNAIAPVPGMLTYDFDRICGSMAVVHYRQSDYPTSGQDNGASSNFMRADNHAYLRCVQEESGRPLAVVPYAAAIYMINTNDNLTFGGVRSAERSANLLSLVHAHAIADPKKLREISVQFSWIASPSAIATG